jgi:hypothetical protein
MQLHNTDFISPSTPSVLLQHTSCPLVSLDFKPGMFGLSRATPIGVTRYP